MPTAWPWCIATRQGCVGPVVRSYLQLDEVLESSRLPQGICIHFINTDLMAVLCGNLHKLLCADLLLHRLLQIGALKDRLEKAFQRRA